MDAPSNTANKAFDDEGSTLRRGAAALPAPATLDTPRRFPSAATPPDLPPAIQDERLEYYAWLFRRGGFRKLNMTFEQFLATISAIQPEALCSDRNG